MWPRPPLAAAAALALLLASCGGGDGESWSARAIAERNEGAEVMPIHAGSLLGVGRNRIAFALFDRDGALVGEASATVRLYTLDGDRGTFVSEHELTPVSLPLEGAVHVHEDRSAHVHEGPAATVFVASAELTRAGDWGAELAVTLNDGEAERLRMRLIVLERTREPMLGEPAPRSVQRVLRDVDDISEIDTSNPPMPELHELTVAEAVDRGRPVLVALATPAFCQTRFCGPVVDTVMRPLHERYRGEVEFVHIEPFDVAAARGGRLELVPAMAEWGLTTEPWIFVIDGSGRVVGKFEGITSEQEVEAALAPLVGSGR